MCFFCALYHVRAVCATHVFMFEFSHEIISANIHIVHIFLLYLILTNIFIFVVFSFAEKL